MNNQRIDETSSLKCPECRANLKQRRGRRADKCEMVCGGCGKVFDVCDLETVEKLKNNRV